MTMLRSKRLFIAGLSVLSLIVVALMVYFFGKNLITETLSAYTLPQELRGATFVVGKSTESVAYKPTLFRYEKILNKVGNISMFSKEGDEVLVVNQTDQGFLLEENGVELVRNSLPIASPAKAPNAAVILYAQALESEKKSDAGIQQGIENINPLNYEIRLYLAASGKNDRVISGYAPLFISDTKFLFFAYSGVYMYDLQSGVGKKILEKNFPVIFGPVLQSPDRSLIAFADAVRNVTYVYRIKNSETELVLETPKMLIRPALSDTALYEMKGTEHGSEIWKYDFDTHQSNLIHTVPRSFGLSRIVF